MGYAAKLGGASNSIPAIHVYYRGGGRIYKNSNNCWGELDVQNIYLLAGAYKYTKFVHSITGQNTSWDNSTLYKADGTTDSAKNNNNVEFLTADILRIFGQVHGNMLQDQYRVVSVVLEMDHYN